MMEDNRFSLENVFQLRSNAFAEISRHTASIDALAGGIADLDAAMQTAIAEHNIDDQQALVTTARQLAATLDGGQA